MDIVVEFLKFVVEVRKTFRLCYKHLMDVVVVQFVVIVVVGLKFQLGSHKPLNNVVDLNFVVELYNFVDLMLKDHPYDCIEFVVDLKQLFVEE